MNVPGAAPLSELQAAWLAGLLDGEGCFDAPRNNPRIRVKMTDLDVVLRAADLMGATTHMEYDRRPSVTGAPHKPLMVAQITGAPALAVMRSILPWLSARRTARVLDLITAYAAREDGRRSRHLRSAA
jgi:hypothetical protein